jgi:hypothetical protein
MAGGCGFAAADKSVASRHAPPWLNKLPTAVSSPPTDNEPNS